jgi:uncharacterized RDD family membrane protein YckC
MVRGRNKQFKEKINEMTEIKKYSTFTNRLGAGIIDGIIFMPLALLFSTIRNDSITAFTICAIVETILYTAYMVIGHGKYGQTLGKRLVGIKVFDLQEKNVIGYKNAFRRESIWFFVAIVEALYLFFVSSKTADVQQAMTESNYYNIFSLTSLAWFFLELGTMMFNKKRRAFHDFMAGSVVVNLNELKRENLHKQYSKSIEESF